MAPQATAGGVDGAAGAAYIPAVSNRRRRVL